MRLARAVTPASSGAATALTVPPGPAPGCSVEIPRQARGPSGVELAEELRAALLLVRLAQGRGGLAQSVERPEKAPVGLFRPAHVARAPPPGGPERVQAPVIPHAEAGVGLHVVPGQL